MPWLVVHHNAKPRYCAASGARMGGQWKRPGVSLEAESDSRYAPGIPSLFWGQMVCCSTGCSGDRLYGLVQRCAVLLMQIKPDFSYTDFLYIQPKLRALLLGAFGDLSAEQQANEIASSYHHTYFKADDLNLHSLMEYPDDAQLHSMLKLAVEDTISLLAPLGIDGNSMLSTYVPPPPYLLIPLPCSSASSTVCPDRQPQNLYKLLFLYQNASLPIAVDECMETMELALAAESIEATTKM